MGYYYKSSKVSVEKAYHKYQESYSVSNPMYQQHLISTSSVIRDLVTEDEDSIQMRMAIAVFISGLTIDEYISYILFQLRVYSSNLTKVISANNNSSYVKHSSEMILLQRILVTARNLVELQNSEISGQLFWGQSLEEKIMLQDIEDIWH